jgi:hypothetical protein
MTLPRLDEAQIVWITRQVTNYIQVQRETFMPSTVLLNPSQKKVMQPFFTAPTLDSTHVVVLMGNRVPNPPFYRELSRMGFIDGSLPDFALMAAITFVDVVVSHEPLTDRLLFHELVHVAQYQKLGLADFAAKYVNGFLTGGSYEAIPLERNAYGLDTRFAAAPMKAFSVEAEVQSWITAGRF